MGRSQVDKHGQLRDRTWTNVDNRRECLYRPVVLPIFWEVW